MAVHTILVLGLCASWVNSLAFVAPKATQAADRIVEWTAVPLPTDGPEHPLFKRQLDGALGFANTAYRASNAVFGYTRDYSSYTYTYTASGASGTSASYSYSSYLYQYPYSCPTSTETAFYQPALIPSEYGRIGCCGPDGCDAPVKCIALQYWQTACKGLPCETDSLTKKCTGTAAYCATVTLGGMSATGYKCTAYSYSTSVYVYTYSSITTGSLSYPYSDVTFSRFSITESTTSTITPPLGPTTPVVLTSSSSTDTPTAVPVPAAAATPVGAIVGGSVGGIALLALVGFAIFFLVSRHRKEKREAAALNPDYSVVHQQQQQQLSPPIYVTGGPDKHHSMVSQAPFGSTSPHSRGMHHGRESFMAGPGYDGAGMVPYERQELDTTPSTVSAMPSVSYGGDGRH